MSKDDISLKNWLSDVNRFVDLYNGGLFNGQQIFTADKVTPLPTESSLIIKDQAGRETVTHRYRDIVMQVEKGPLLMLLACENQKEIHYAMPVRSMLYDSLNYTAQIREKAKKHRKQKELHGSAEFLSGITSEDRLIPCLPLVFYYGDQKWTGSKDLYGLLDIPSEYRSLFKKFIPNYKINLIDINTISKKLNKKKYFQSDLQWILGMIQYKNSKEKLLKYIYEHKDFFRHIDEDSYTAATVLLGSEEQIKFAKEDEGGDIDMCKALEDLYMDGIENGIEKGIKALISDNMEDGKDEAIIISKLQKHFSLDKKKAQAYFKKYGKKAL